MSFNVKDNSLYSHWHLITGSVFIIYLIEYEKTIEDFTFSHSFCARLFQLSGTGKWQGDTPAFPGPCQWKVEQGRNDHDNRPANLDKGS
jgi:hypothetical protein